MGTEQPVEWYLVYVTLGQEDRVRAAIETRAQSMGLAERIVDVQVPTQEVTEVQSGERVRVRRKLFPGYILVRMALDEVTWHAVRGTPGVAGFVGPETHPEPLPPAEADRIFRRTEQVPEPVGPAFTRGMTVRVVDGPFSQMIGTLDVVNEGRRSAVVAISMFGRETPVELGFDQLEPA